MNKWFIISMVVAVIHGGVAAKMGVPPMNAAILYIIAAASGAFIHASNKKG
jgi:hypothetical protein